MLLVSFIFLYYKNCYLTSKIEYNYVLTLNIFQNQFITFMYLFDFNDKLDFNITNHIKLYF